MLPVISKHPSEEPTIPVVIQDKKHIFMIDTGATYSCIGNEGSHLPLSQSLVKTIGFSGKKTSNAVNRACADANRG